MQGSKNAKILEEILIKYSMNKRFFRWQNQKFLSKKLNRIYWILKFFWIIFGVLTFIFLIISFIIIMPTRYSNNIDKQENFAHFQLLYTATFCAGVAIISALVCFVFCKLNPEKKFVLDFNSWSVNKIVNESGFQFQYLKNFESLASNNELKIQKVDKLAWSEIKSENLEFLFDFFTFQTTNISTHFKITTSKDIIFYLKYSKVPENFRVYENENFLIIGSEFLNKDRKIALENKGFKFWKEKESKIYFWNPGPGFNIFEIQINNPSFLSIIEKLEEQVEIKLKELDQIAKIING